MEEQSKLFKENSASTHFYFDLKSNYILKWH